MNAGFGRFSAFNNNVQGNHSTQKTVVFRRFPFVISPALHRTQCGASGVYSVVEKVFPVRNGRTPICGCHRLNKRLPDQFEFQAHLHVVIHEQRPVILVYRVNVRPFQYGAILGNRAVPIGFGHMCGVLETTVAVAMEFDLVNGLLPIPKNTSGRDAGLHTEFLLELARLIPERDLRLGQPAVVLHEVERSVELVFPTGINRQELVCGRQGGNHVP